MEARPPALRRWRPDPPPFAMLRDEWEDSHSTLPQAPAVTVTSRAARERVNNRVTRTNALGALRKRALLKRAIAFLKGGLPASAPSSDALHWRSCAAPHCPRCKFVRNSERWSRCTLIDPKTPSSGSWLQSRVLDGRWGLGCAVCHKNGRCSGVWGSYLASRNVQWHTIAHHARSKEHRHAMLQAAGVDMEPFGVPSRAKFRLVWQHVLRGTSLAQGTPGVGQRKLVQRMIFCLAEARKRLDREHFQSVEAVTLHQDGCAGRLVVRFAAVDTHCTLRRGYLGHINQQEFAGGGAVGIARSTQEILRQMCTPLCGAPGASTEQVVDQVLLDRVSAAVCAINADAAGDEQAAARHLQSQPPLQDFAAPFANCKIIIQDKCHGARRRTEPTQPR